MIVVQSLVKSENHGEIKHNYFYRLVKSKVQLDLNMETIEVQSYGIEVERQDSREDGIINIERECIENISPHRHKVQNLMKKLYDFSVSPVHLIDVLGEYVDSYILDFDEILKDIATN